MKSLDDQEERAMSRAVEAGNRPCDDDCGVIDGPRDGEVDLPHEVWERLWQRGLIGLRLCQRERWAKHVYPTDLGRKILALHRQAAS